jgi:hypothetical protein
MTFLGKGVGDDRNPEEVGVHIFAFQEVGTVKRKVFRKPAFFQPPEKPPGPPRLPGSHIRATLPARAESGWRTAELFAHPQVSAYPSHEFLAFHWRSGHLRDGWGFTHGRGGTMSESVYKVIELVGTSTEGWEEAAAAAVKKAARSLRDLRIAEVGELDMVLGEDGTVIAYRAKVKVSFKFQS